MFETVSTNGAAILTMLVLWSTLVGLVVYLYMSEKVKNLVAQIEVLDWYAYYADKEVAELIDELMDRDVHIAQLREGEPWQM